MMLATNKTPLILGPRGDTETSADWRQRIAAHEEAQTCTMCGQPFTLAARRVLSGKPKDR